MNKDQNNAGVALVHLQTIQQVLFDLNQQLRAIQDGDTTPATLSFNDLNFLVRYTEFLRRLERLKSDFNDTKG